MNGINLAQYQLSLHRFLAIFSIHWLSEGSRPLDIGYWRLNIEKQGRKSCFLAWQYPMPNIQYPTRELSAIARNYILGALSVDWGQSRYYIDAMRNRRWNPGPTANLMPLIFNRWDQWCGESHEGVRRTTKVDSLHGLGPQREYSPI